MAKTRSSRATKSVKNRAKKSVTHPKRKKVIKKAPPTKRTVQTRRSKRLSAAKETEEVIVMSKKAEKPEPARAPRYNVWRKKSVYGPLYRRLESYKQRQMKEEAKEAAKDKKKAEAKQKKKEEAKKLKAKEDQRLRREQAKLEIAEKKLKEALSKLKKKKRSLSREKKKKGRHARILDESESEYESEEEEEEESESIREESAEEDSDSEEIRPKRRRAKKKPKPEEVYIYKKGKLIPMQIVNEISSDPDSEEPATCRRSKSAQQTLKMRESRRRKEKNSKRLMKQIKEQQTRMDTLERTKERYCLIDFWEDFNNTADLKNNLRRGRISSARGTRTRTYNFKLKKSVSSAEYNIQIDDDLFMRCSCPDWRTTCKGLGIVCKHMIYLMKYIIKYPISDVEDNQIQDKLVFYKNLEHIKLDYNEEVAKDNAQKNKCVICYGDLFKKQGWTWTIDFENAVCCPDCKKPVHRKCAEVWLKSSDNKNCVFCRSPRFQHVV